MSQAPVKLSLPPGAQRGRRLVLSGVWAPFPGPPSLPWASSGFLFGRQGLLCPAGDRPPQPRPEVWASPSVLNSGANIHSWCGDFQLPPTYLHGGPCVGRSQSAHLVNIGAEARTLEKPLLLARAGSMTPMYLGGVGHSYMCAPVCCTCTDIQKDSEAGLPASLTWRDIWPLHQGHRD